MHWRKADDTAFAMSLLKMIYRCMSCESEMAVSEEWLGLHRRSVGACMMHQQFAQTIQVPKDINAVCTLDRQCIKASIILAKVLPAALVTISYHKTRQALCMCAVQCMHAQDGADRQAETRPRPEQQHFR